MTSVARHDSGDYSDASPQEIEQDHTRNDGGQHESDYESAGSESDRSGGDPEENQETERRVDDDEDRSNPQYIPKRGTFYEHDDRTADNGEESANTTSEITSDKKEGTETPDRRRPPRKTEANKWAHDKYNEREQTPKSREELIGIYGYDIRNEDAPPHARRNRRYGRGPNKYTRTWEDEEAYKRQAAAQQLPRKPPTAEDFPELDGRKNIKKRIQRPRSKSQPSSNDSLDTSNGSLRRNDTSNGSLRRNDTNGSLRRTASVKKPSPRQNRERERDRAPVKREKEMRDIKKETIEKMPPIENLTITASVFNNNNQSQPQRKANVTVAQQRPVPTQQIKKPVPPQPQSPPEESKPVPVLRQPAPPETRASKRYSSLRQRPLDTQPRLPYSNEYPPVGSPGHPPHQTNAPHAHPQQQIMQQMQRNANQQQHGPSPPHQQIPQQQIQQQQLQQQQLQQQQIQQQQLQQQQIQQQQIQQQQQQIQQQQIQQQQMPQQQMPQQQMPQQQMQQLPQQQISQQHSQQVRLGMLDQQQMVSHPHHTMHNIPQPHAMGQLQASQAYAPPAMMPAQYMQPQAAPSFSAAPIYAQPPAPYAHPNMYNPHHNYAAQTGGLTYYGGLSAVEPETPRTQRRPTAAIPIVRPAAPDRPANSSEKDNIDRIVENMFVRKPWPGPGEASKDKESRGSQEPASKESSQPNSLTSSSISIDSKPSEEQSVEGKVEKSEAKVDVQVENKVPEPEVQPSELKSPEVEGTSIDA